MLTLQTLYNDSPSILSSLDIVPKCNEVRAGVLLKCGELFVLYPNPDIMRAKIAEWVQLNLEPWEKLYNTTLLKYNPISNHGKTEEWENTSENEAESTTNGNATNTDKVKAFDSGELAESASHIAEDGQSGTSKSKKTIKHKATISGNVGVSVQKLVIEEREAAAYNLSNIIAESFKEHFCILVY